MVFKTEKNLTIFYTSKLCHCVELIGERTQAFYSRYFKGFTKNVPSAMLFVMMLPSPRFDVLSDYRDCSVPLRMRLFPPCKFTGFLALLMSILQILCERFSSLKFEPVHQSKNVFAANFP